MYQVDNELQASLLLLLYLSYRMIIECPSEQSPEKEGGFLTLVSAHLPLANMGVDANNPPFRSNNGEIPP